MIRRAFVDVVQPGWFFGSWDEDVYVPVDEAPAVQAPISGMNQQLISRVETMRKYTCTLKYA